ncbi:MAG TPA: DUF4435 domain-containing protein [Bacteroidaceae bacterium]|nr:DUF4435 domain-containing protein [Bacteroidaceae bacterium]
MKRLLDNINSRYIEAANTLKPKFERKKIVAYVESYEDIAFWRLLLEEFETDEFGFQIMLPCRKDLTKGKKSAIRNHLGDSPYGTNLIACVDSDYDYLLNGATYTSQQLLESEYIFHTYAYSIENYQCYANSLYQVCVQSTLNDRRLVNFKAFLEYYSQIIFPLFVWNIWFYREKIHSQFCMQDFNRIIRIGSVDVNNPHKVLEDLIIRVEAKIRWLEKKYTLGVKQVEIMKEEFESFGVTPTNTYMFIQGHHLKDNIVIKLLNPICARLKRERELEIERLALHEEQYKNEVKAYQNSQITLDEALRKNTHYRESETYQRMRDDMRRFVDSLTGKFNETSKKKE